jgi:hypothetical protein
MWIRGHTYRDMWILANFCWLNYFVFIQGNRDMFSIFPQSILASVVAVFDQIKFLLGGMWNWKHSLSENTRKKILLCELAYYVQGFQHSDPWHSWVNEKHLM